MSFFKKNDSYVQKKRSEGMGDQASPEASSSGMDLNKMAAAASIAQQMGVVPQDGEVGGAISGAATGAAFGPVGAAVGGVAGAVMGAASARAAAKAHNRQVEAQKHAALAEIQQRKGEQMSSAIQNMAARMSIR